MLSNLQTLERRDSTAAIMIDTSHSPVLDHQGRVAACKGFIRPVLEYAPLAWMGAAKSHLDRLDGIQRSTLHILGPGILLPSLRIGRPMAALAYLYKLHYTTGPPQLQAMVPPPATPIQNDRQTRGTRARHASQLQFPGRNAPDYARRSFPFSVVVEWNSLPVDLLPTLTPCERLPDLQGESFTPLNTPKLGMVNRLTLIIPPYSHLTYF